MYIQTETRQIPCAASAGGGDWVFRGAGVEDVEGAFALYADDGMLLRDFDTGGWLRAVRGEGSLTLTNTPEPAPAPEPEPMPEEEYLTVQEMAAVLREGVNTV